MIKILNDAEHLNRFAADKIVEIVDDSIDANGKCAVALSGGRTPKALYQTLAGDEYNNKIDWTKVFFFFGDERNVLPDDSESNYRMARENLLKPLRISETNVFRWKTEIKDAAQIAADYERAVKDFFSPSGDEFPKFDLVLLGMGDDGHTASLFPQTKALSETEKLVAANFVEKLNANRLTLTFRAINSAKNVLFLVAGAKKAPMIKKVLSTEAIDLPAGLIKPENGNCRWFLDGEAAGLIDV